MTAFSQAVEIGGRSCKHEDSDFGETRAKEEIWEDFDAFSQAAHRARAAAG